MKLSTALYILTASSLVSVATAQAPPCPRDGFNPFELPFAENVYSSSRDTNGGSNTFKIDKNCVYSISGESVSGTEKFEYPQDWLDRAAVVYDGTLVSSDATIFTGNGPPALEEIFVQPCDSNWCVTIAATGEAVDVEDKIWSFSDEPKAQNFLQFLFDVIANDVRAWMTNAEKKCDSGPFCYDNKPSTTCYIDPVSENCGEYDFLTEGGTMTHVRSPDVWTWFLACLEDFGCTQIKYGSFNYGTPFRNAFFHSRSGMWRFKLSGNAIGGSIQWECPSEEAALDVKAFADAVAQASLFDTQVPQGECETTPATTTPPTTTTTPATTTTPPPVVRASCKAHLDAGETQDGLYWIDPDGDGNGVDAFEVWCDQTTEVYGLQGGWALLMYDSDTYVSTFTDPVLPTAYGIAADSHWQALRDTFVDGIMTKDEHDNVAFVSFATLQNANCRNPWDLDSLLPTTSSYVYIWSYEDSGCNSVGLDYCNFILNQDYVHGTNIINRCTHPASQWDVWPYTGLVASRGVQDERWTYIR